MRRRLLLRCDDGEHAAIPVPAGLLVRRGAGIGHGEPVQCWYIVFGWLVLHGHMHAMHGGTLLP